MKSHSPLIRCAGRQLRWLSLGLICQVAATNAWAVAGPTITGTSSTLNINDAQTSTMFQNATVTAGTTNVLTVTVDFVATNLGTLAPLPSGVVRNGNNYVIGPATDSAATTILNQLTFTPVNNLIPVGSASNVVFHVSAVDANNNSSTVRTTTVQVTALNDPPTLTASGVFRINDKQTASPFGSVSASDPDNSGTQPQTITITLAHTNTGFLVVGASGFVSNNLTYTLTGVAPAAVGNAISGLIYQPIENVLPVGQYDTNVFTIVDSDGVLTATNTGVSVIVLSTNDAPVLTGAPASHIPIATGHSLSPSPFATLTLRDVDQNDNISDPNGQTLNWSVTLTGPPPLGQLTLSGNPVGTAYSSSGEPPTATASLRNLSYLAPVQTIAGTNFLQIAITADDQHGGRLTNYINLDLYSIILPPGLSGTQSGQTVNDNATIAPFSKVTIQSHNGNPVTLKIQLAGVATNDIQGSFLNLGNFIKDSSVSPSVYQFSGTSEAATAAIEALLFQPTPNRINGSQTDVATFGITLIDGTITNAPDFSTAVTIVPVNDVPTIFGISPLTTIQDNQTLPPFSTVLISDVDEGGQQVNTCTITMNNPTNGIFSYSSLTNSTFTTNGSSYTMSGTPAAITAAIRKLVFVPTANEVAVGLTVTTTFSVVLDDGHGGHVVNNATAIRVASVSGMPVVSIPVPQPASLPAGTNVLPFAGVSISDPTALKVNLRINNPAQGYFATNSVNSNGFTNRGGGNYYIAGTAASVNTAMQNLAFVPASNLPFGSVINFTISVTNALPNYVSVNHAIILRTVRNSYIVTKLTDYDPAGNVAANLQVGTLRNAIANARSGDHITFDIRSGVAGVADYPAVIRLVKTLTLNNDVTFDGPGADRLTISGDSDGNGTPDVELFTVNAKVVANRLAFANGYASAAGGAFEVNATGSLKLSYCSLTGCRADQWGGAVDINGGVLNADHCLFAGNSTSSQLGQSGGAVSIYSEQVCTLLADTFATNQQNSAGGLGGGALYAETYDPGVELDVHVLSCTFVGNLDAGGQGSSIRPNVENTYVELQNTILADGQGKNIEMDQSGNVLSLGGNISDDSTYSIFSAGGVPQDNFVFSPPLDQTNVSPASLFSALANNSGPTATCALIPGSSALNNAISNFPAAPFFATLGTDQRGYFRTNTPDIGAFEAGASQRIIIEEIGFNPPNTNEQFIEFYVPRDSTALDLGGFQVLVDGVLRHTFASQVMQPGQGLVLFSLNSTNSSVPGYIQKAAGALSLSQEGGVITLLNPAGQTVFEADYVGAFVSTDPNDYGYLTNPNQSLVLSPLFQGVFLPYDRVVAKDGGSNTNGLSDPGYDDKHVPLSGDNAPPIAYGDSAATDAHTIIPAIAVLANDVDPDITDTIEVVDVGTNDIVGETNQIGYSALGARLTINNSPTAGASIMYDPTASAYLESLPQGSNVVDTFQYTILDYSNNVPHDRGSNPAANTANATATVTVAVVGVNSPPAPQNDSTNTSARLTTFEDTVLDFTTATNILWNDIDTNSDDSSLTLSIISLCATNGYVPNLTNITTALGATVWLDIRFDRNQTHITYDPRGSAVLNALATNQWVNDTFYYTVRDRYGAVGTAAISIRVNGVDDAPTANPDSLTTDENTALTVPAAYFLANDTDPDNGATLSIASVTPFSADGASVQLVGTNVVYNPAVSTILNALAQKEFATDTFTYTVTDGLGLTSNAVVTVRVAGVNDVPVLQPDFYTTNEDSLLTVPAAQGVLANDHDPDAHDTIRVIPFTINTATNCYTGPNGGVPVTMAANGSFTFDPRVALDGLKQGEVFQDTFSYVVMDHSLSIANDDNFSVNTGTSNNVLAVLANDAVLSGVGGAFTITGVSTPDHGGTVAINTANNALSYTPAAGYVGPETFSYMNSDGLGGGDHATVTVTVAGSTLYAVADAFTVAKGTTNVLNLLANDVIIPATGANISITGFSPPAQGGTLSFNGTGPNNAVNYTPNPAVSAPYADTFTYTITSGSLTATGQVTVTVVDRANALSLAAGNDRFTVIAGSGNNVLDVLTNDIVMPGTVSNLFITGFTTNSLLGTVSLNAAQTRLLYKPGPGITSQSESFTYYFSDGAGGTGSASVLVQVVPGGFAANDDNFLIVKNSTNTLPVMVNDVELPNIGQTLFISDVGIGTNAPSHGTVTINGPGTGLIYIPTPNYNGVDDFTYEISDGSPARALGHVHVTILDNSAAPSNPDVYRVARESANNVLPVLANDYTLPPTPGALKIIALQTGGAHATVTINGNSINNSLFYTPNAGFIGRDYFSYVFTDTYGNQGTNLVTVTVGDLAPRDDAFNVVSGTTNNFLDVRANDYSIPDTNALRTIYTVGTPDQGGAATTNNGATGVWYTPAPGFTGVEHFSYQLKDDTTNIFAANVTVTVRRNGSDRDTNTVTVAVVGVNDEPTITGAQSGFHITDKQTIQPFTNDVIGDLDECGFQLNTVTVRLDNAVKGTLTNLGGFVSIAPGVYQMQDTPPAITASLKALVFVPTENRIIVPTSELTTFTIVANDGYGLPVTNNTTTVLVDSVNDAPVISGTQGGFQINDKQTVQPFTTAVITEVDDSTLQSLNVRVSLDNAVKGVLQNLGGFTNAGNGVYIMQGIAANITTSLKTLVFVPTENRITVPTSEVTTLTISVNDGFTSSPVTNNATTITVTATNDPSTIAGVQGGYQINDKQTVAPFTNVIIADVDDLGLQPLNVTVALDLAAKGVLQNLGGFTNSAPGIYTMRGVATNVSSSIRNLTFKPTENRITVPASELTTLTITVNDGFQLPFITDANTTITVTATNDPPTIVGTATNNITDKQTVQPFSSVTFGDVDNLAAVPANPQVLTARIVMDNLDKGSLSNLGGFTVVSNGVFQMAGFAPALTTAIRGLLYTPVENLITVPTTATIHFNLSVADGFEVNPTTNLAVVNVTAVNDAPTIAGTVAGQLIYDRLTLKPFAGVLITELDNDRTQALRATITLDSASKGVLTALGGFTDLGGGVYSMGVSNGTTTAAAITTAMRGLVFSPTTANRVTPGFPETTRFTIRVDDFFAPTVVDSNTTVIAMDPLSAKVTANDRLANVQFGWSVATLRDLAVIGAPHDTATNAGSAYLYARSQDGSNTWTQIRKFNAPDAHANDAFGTAVSISDDLIVIGAPLASVKATSDGASYVYGRNQGGSNQWGFVKKLVAADGFLQDQFGSAVVVSNTLVVIGSPLADYQGLSDSGAVYIYDQNQGGTNQWGQVKKLLNTNSVAGDRFGTAIAMQGDTVVVGAPLTDNGGTVDEGMVYIFERNAAGANQWGLVKKILNTNTIASDHFGAAVAVYGDNLAVGSPLYDVGAISDGGAAYLFNRNTNGTEQWGQFKKFTLTNAFTADHYGSALALTEHSLVVTAPQVDGTNGVDYGVAYLYQDNQGGTNVWGQVDKFQPAAVGTSDNFGCSVAMSRGTIVVGAYNGLDSGQRYGTAYMFRIFYDNPPQLLLPVINQFLQVNVPFAFALPAGAFTDPDYNDVLTYGLSGSVPAWLNYDLVAGNFSGTPTAAGIFPINLVATDVYGTSTTNQFTLTVTGTGQVNFNLLTAAMAPNPTSKVLAVQFSGVPGYAYRLQQATNLANPVWSDVATQVTDVNGTLLINLTNPPATSFYRTVYP
ncbi:MAG: Ig-like domain-containing protein [Verrucomicrobiae bacterium]|nr:Ig-like domain-containing protein [Verrucomicrobiae bacterium]